MINELLLSSTEEIWRKNETRSEIKCGFTLGAKTK
jgi:hypothetical protein